mmetsp:Transcript_20364/g.26506  ORF Transcript_20364/g.26506 Transcript_20364/m.26506 type:complete len:127 (+) Transcript_20364:97-477(+)
MRCLLFYLTLMFVSMTCLEHEQESVEEFRQETAPWREYSQLVYMTTASLIDFRRPPDLQRKRFILAQLFLEQFKSFQPTNMKELLFKMDAVPQFETFIPSTFSRILNDMLTQHSSLPRVSFFFFFK